MKVKCSACGRTQQLAFGATAKVMTAERKLQLQHLALWKSKPNRCPKCAGESKDSIKWKMTLTTGYHLIFPEQLEKYFSEMGLAQWKKIKSNAEACRMFRTWLNENNNEAREKETSKSRKGF